MIARTYKKGYEYITADNEKVILLEYLKQRNFINKTDCIEKWKVQTESGEVKEIWIK